MEAIKRRGGKIRRELGDCNDESVMARMREVPGRRFQPVTLAKNFRVPVAVMSLRLRRLVIEQKVRSVREDKHTLYYIPTPAMLDAEQRLREKEQGRDGWSALSTLKIWHPGDPEPA